MLDLDDFQGVNNSMGHQAGDEAAARIASGLVRPAATPTSCSATAATSSRSCCRAPTRGRAAGRRAGGAAVRGLGGPVTASIGVATFPTDGATAADVLLAADRACFVAKREGRDRVATAAEGLALAAEFRPRRRRRSTRRSRSRTRVVSTRPPPAEIAANGDHAPMTQRLATQQLGWLAALGIAIVVLGGACIPIGARVPRADPLAPPPSATAPAATPSPTPSGPSTRPSFIYPTPTPLPTFLVYEVRSGDTLTSIARTHGTTPRSIAFWNRERYPSLDPDSPTYSPNRIEVGWELLLVPDVEVDPEDLPEPSTAPPSRRVRPRPRADDSAARGLNRRRARPGTGTRTAST